MQMTGSVGAFEGIQRPMFGGWLGGTSTLSLSRVLWTRALPGSVAVLATLAVPGLSLGADILSERSQSGAADAELPLAPGSVPSMRPTPVPVPIKVTPSTPRLRFVIAPQVVAMPVSRPAGESARAGRTAPLELGQVSSKVSAPVAEAPAAMSAPVSFVAPAVRPPVEIAPAANVAAVTRMDVQPSVRPAPAASLPAAPVARVAAAPALAPKPAAAPAAAAPAPALVAVPQAKSPLPAPGIGRADALRVDIKSQLLTRIDGKSVGKVDFRQTDAGLQVRLGSVVDLLGDRYEAGELARLQASSASNVYVSLAALQAQGIPISYDPVYDEFNIGSVDARPKAGLKVHMEQISTPERGAASTAMEQIRR